MITSRRQTITMAIPLGLTRQLRSIALRSIPVSKYFFRINKKPEQSKVIKLLIVQVQ